MHIAHEPVLPGHPQTAGGPSGLQYTQACQRERKGRRNVGLAPNPVLLLLPMRKTTHSTTIQPILLRIGYVLKTLCCGALATLREKMLHVAQQSIYILVLVLFASYILQRQCYGQELRFARGPQNYMFQKLIFIDRYSIFTTSARLARGFILHSVLQNGIEKWHHSQEIGVPENRPFSFFSTP